MVCRVVTGVGCRMLVEDWEERLGSRAAAAAGGCGEGVCVE